MLLQILVFIVITACSRVPILVDCHGLGIHGTNVGGNCGIGYHNSLRNLPASRLGLRHGYANAYSYGLNPLRLNSGLQNGPTLIQLKERASPFPLANPVRLANHIQQRPIVVTQKIPVPVAVPVPIPVPIQQQSHTSPVVPQTDQKLLLPSTQYVEQGYQHPPRARVPEEGYSQNGYYVPGEAFSSFELPLNHFSNPNQQHYNHNNQGNAFIYPNNEPVHPNQYHTGQGQAFSGNGIPFNFYNDEFSASPAVGRVTNKRQATSNGEISSNSVVISRGGKLSSATRTVTNRIYY